MPILGSALLTVGLIWGLILPLAVLFAIFLEPRLIKPEPLWMRRCRGVSPNHPASRACWVPVGEYCPRHDRPAQSAPVPEDDRLIA